MAQTGFERGSSALEADTLTEEERKGRRGEREVVGGWGGGGRKGRYVREEDNDNDRFFILQESWISNTSDFSHSALVLSYGTHMKTIITYT